MAANADWRGHHSLLRRPCLSSCPVFTECATPSTLVADDAEAWSRASAVAPHIFDGRFTAFAPSVLTKGLEKEIRLAVRRSGPVSASLWTPVALLHRKEACHPSSQPRLPSYLLRSRRAALPWNWEIEMTEYILLMHDDAISNDDSWGPYIQKLQQGGFFEGGSAIGDGVCVRKSGEPASVTVHLTGYIRVIADSIDQAKSLLTGNPHFEAGGTVEIRELPRTD